MLKLVDIGSVYDDPRRTIRVLDTDRDQVECTTAVLKKETNYSKEWSFYASGNFHTMKSELVFDPVHGTKTKYFIEE